MILKLLIYVLTGYMLLCVILFLLQRKMLYFPDKSHISKDRAAQAGQKHWPENQPFKGFTSIIEPTHPRGTIILFHGNAGNAIDRSFYSKALVAHDFRVILAEYPGYGDREGSPNESVLVKDALEIITLAHEQYPEPVFVWGESLGCAVAAGAVQKTKIPVHGLILFLPWDNLADLAQTHYRYLPVRWLIRDTYNSVENLKEFKGRVAVLLAGNDEIIPVKHGHNLYDSIKTDKKLWVFDGATHNAMPVDPDIEWWKEVTQFLMQGDTL